MVAAKSTRRRSRWVDASTRGSGRSGGEARAALGPTTVEDRAARPGAHTQPEAVRLGPATVVGLEGALAHVRLRWRSVVRAGLAGTKSRRADPAQPFQGTHPTGEGSKRVTEDPPVTSQLCTTVEA